MAVRSFCGRGGLDGGHQSRYGVDSDPSRGGTRQLLPIRAARPASVIFVGYAARGTPARRIIDGARSVMLLGEEVPVRAQVHTINGFSAHADQAELLRWHARAGGAERTILIHGESGAMSAFAALLPGGPLSMPAPAERLTL